MNKQWIVQNAPMLFLGALVFIQWIAFQVLVVHYHNFRKSLKKPRPDGIRMGLLEKAVAIQTENVDALFIKMGELRREIAVANAQAVRPSKVDSTTSIEGSMMTMGEINLKKRLAEMSAEPPTTH